MTSILINFYFNRMEQVLPVKLFAAILYGQPPSLDSCCSALEAVFGPMDYQSPASPFDVTTYYEKEMGAPLFRVLVSFANHVQPAQLPDIKLKSVAVKSGEIIVEMTKHGPKDPLCCPTQEVTQVYTLQGEKLVKTK